MEPATETKTKTKTKTYKTPDISTAAYMWVQGLNLVSADFVDGEREIVLEDPEGRAKQLLIDWHDSPAKKYDDKVVGIKRLLRNGSGHDQGPRGRARRKGR